MKNTILITGANSFIAKHLIPILENDYNIKLLTRHPKSENEYRWDVEQRYIDEKALDNVDYIIHLAGSKLNDGTPLTEERKKLVYDSRIGAANLLRDKLKARNQKLKSFVSASAIGYYGYTDNTLEIDENGAMGRGFGAELSHDWEVAADQFKIDGVAENVAKIRVSLVMGRDGGIFPAYLQMLKSNPQLINENKNSYIPWNHVDDMAGIFAFAVTNHLDGVFNSVAPEPASQSDIFKAIDNALHQKNNPIEQFRGQHLISDKIQKLGFNFKFKNIENTVKDIV